MICPECGAWCDFVHVFEKAWLRYEFYLQGGQEHWEDQEFMESCNDDEVAFECPVCGDEIQMSLKEIKKKMQFCEDRKRTQKCNRCRDRFKCWTVK